MTAGAKPYGLAGVCLGRRETIWPCGAKSSTGSGGMSFSAAMPAAYRSRLRSLHRALGIHLRLCPPLDSYRQLRLCFERPVA